MKIILGKKIRMTQQYTEKGVVPVTVIAAGPCTVTLLKSRARDGYSAVQLGYDPQRKNLRKPQAGHLRGLTLFRYLREFRIDPVDLEHTGVRRGSVLTVSQFQVGDTIAVTGISKGKGFQGVVKRHGFHGSPASHGHKDQLRMPGSIGAGGVQRVFKGTRMAGRTGGAQTTIQHMSVIKVDADANLLYVKGAVPGARNSLLLVSANRSGINRQSPIKVPHEASNAETSDSVRAQGEQSG